MSQRTSTLTEDNMTDTQAQEAGDNAKKETKAKEKKEKTKEGVRKESIKFLPKTPPKRPNTHVPRNL